MLSLYMSLLFGRPGAPGPGRSLEDRPGARRGSGALCSEVLRPLIGVVCRSMGCDYRQLRTTAQDFFSLDTTFRTQQDGRMTEPRYYTVEELADTWRVHPETVRRLVRRGQLAATRVGSLIRITQEAADAYLRDAARDDDTAETAAHDL